LVVIPTQAGIQLSYHDLPRTLWIPARAGMTEGAAASGDTQSTTSTNHQSTYVEEKCRDTPAKEGIFAWLEYF